LAGIYIHVPFCKRRCYYCDFYSSIRLDLIDNYLEALKNEAYARSNYFYKDENNTIIDTLYFGGGTPSLLSIEEYREILQHLSEIYQISPSAEITVEINPDDAELELLKNLKVLGCNRLSIGVQSFSDTTLKFINRRHNSAQALKSIENAAIADISNISIDLIYGLPGMSVKKWGEALRQAIKMPIKHISAYHLTYEKGSRFNTMVTKGQISAVSENISIKQFELLHEILEINGFEHYEISNFAKDNLYSIHNSNYWKGENYLGLGPSAHSYDGISRRWNVSDIKKYCNSLQSGEVYWETENLNKTNLANEYIMTRLRTKWGIDLNSFSQEFGIDRREKLLKDIQPFIASNHCELNRNIVVLTLNGWIISDRILVELISI
jgi:putative oxygen-independent coproporphyrinogen III oxidase